MPDELEIFLMTDQPPTCPKCGARVVIIEGAETSRQVVQCPECSFRYKLEEDEDATKTQHVCRHCKWWSYADVWREDPKRKTKPCRHPSVKRGYHYRDQDIPDDGVNVEDDEGWGLVTGPLFGCVHWEEKPSDV